VRITPPPPPSDPVTVFVADYGRHASLVIPTDPNAEGVNTSTGDVVLGNLEPGEPAMWEYSFGDWLFYARDDDWLVNGGFALLLPTRGALGRRKLAFADTATRLRANFDAPLEHVHPIRVERERAGRLLADLHERFNEGLRYADELGVEPERNTAVNLVFAPDRESYSMLNHCNHELAGWLRELGADTRGNSLVSRYTVSERD
jgi:hypothetical protein